MNVMFVELYVPIVAALLALACVGRWLGNRFPMNEARTSIPLPPDEERVHAKVIPLTHLERGEANTRLLRSSQGYPVTAYDDVRRG